MRRALSICDKEQHKSGNTRKLQIWTPVNVVVLGVYICKIEVRNCASKLTHNPTQKIVIAKGLNLFWMLSSYFLEDLLAMKNDMPERRQTAWSKVLPLITSFHSVCSLYIVAHTLSEKKEFVSLEICMLASTNVICQAVTLGCIANARPRETCLWALLSTPCHIVRRNSHLQEIKTMIKCWEEDIEYRIVTKLGLGNWILTRISSHDCSKI